MNEAELGRALGEKTIEASQQFVLDAVRKRFDADYAFASVRLTVWYEMSTQWYWIYVSFPFLRSTWSDEPGAVEGKVYNAKTTIDDVDLSQMTSPSDFRTIINRAYDRLRNLLRDELKADGVTELAAARRRGAAILLGEEPSEQTREEVMALLREAVSRSSS